MLAPRIYRAALLPVLLALLVVAFSLDPRPRAIGTTVPPDAFDKDKTGQLLDNLAARYPSRRPGSPQDIAMARDIAARLNSALHLKATPGAAPAVRMQHFSGQTIDGKKDLVNVIATRPGAPGPGIVVLAHRDAAGRGAKAELSGTAALLQLAAIAGDGRLRRTITFVSTTGGSGGAAGARAVARLLPGSVEAVLVLGDLGGARVHKPFVTTFSNSRGLAPLQLRQTVALALRNAIRADPGAPRASTQWAREAFPVTLGEQGALLRAGLPAVLVSVSGERGPRPGDKVLRSRLQAFGRGVLSTIFALDNGPDLKTGIGEYVVTQRKVLPGWAVRLLGIALLGPVLLCALDGFARMRRKRRPLGRAMLWVLATAFPFAITAAAAVLFAMTGLIDPAPRAALTAPVLQLDGSVAAATAALLMILGLGFAGLRPLALRLAGVQKDTAADGTAVPACAVLVTLALAGLGVWVTSPFAAVLLAPAANLWLIAITPDWRLARPVRLVLIALGFVPLLATLAIDMSSLGYSLPDALWQSTVLVAAGQVGAVTWLLWSVIAACAVCAVKVALKSDGAVDERDTPVTVRGPVSYAGPGSLGGTQSALRK